MKVAAIDIGTNSMRLLIADYEKNDIVDFQKIAKVTKIGRGVDSNRFICKQAIDENLEALSDFVDTARKNNAEKITIMATSALRDAKNSEEFLSKAYERTGIRVVVMSGDMEAKLGFLGAGKLISEKEPTLTIDIGGGSTEFIVGNVAGDILFSKSENVGCVRLTEKFLHSDPPTEFETSCMNEFVYRTFKDTIDILNDFSLSDAIGIGGTFTSASSMLQGLKIYSPLKVHNSKIYIDDVENLYASLSRMDLSQKQMITGLQANRADVIFAGVAIIRIIMRELHLPYITVSEYDNLEGLIFDLMKQ